MGFRGRLRRLERTADDELVVVQLEDGTTACFREEEMFPGCFLHEYERGRRAHDGEEPGEAHPFVVALRSATNLEALASQHGTILSTWLGEDEIIRGERERPGPPVRETSAGVYE